MDKNQTTGMVLMLILLGIYFYFFGGQEQLPPPPVEDATEQVAQDPATGPATIAAKETTAQDDSLANAIRNQRFGLFAPFASGEAQDFVLENEEIKVALSSKGAAVKSVLLKNHVTFDQKPLYLINDNSSRQDLIVQSNYKSVNLAELNYEVKTGKRTLIVDEQDVPEQYVSFRLSFDDGKYIEHTYSLQEGKFEVGYELNFVGVDGLIDNQNVLLNWYNDMRVVEKALVDSRQKTTINYFTSTDGFDNVSISNDPESETFGSDLKWAAFKQKFFTQAIIAENNFASGYLSTSVNEADSSVVKSGVMELVLPIGDLRSGNGKFKYFFGPNNFQIAKKVTEGFGENVEMGWGIFRWVNMWLIVPIFDFLSWYFTSYGLIILLMVIIIRIMLSPLTYKSHMSMAKMKVLKPEMDEIKERHGGDMQKSQGETMELYRKAGINPLSGCIPILLQMPILLALFNFFPNSIELRQKAFLWAHDLSTYDSILDLPFSIPMYGDHVSLFTLLMTASTILYTWSNSQMNSQLQGPMKTMQYVMPIMFLFFLNSYSSGLTYYYFLTNIFSFGQIALFRKLVDEDKIHAIMQENKKKNANKKKSKFQLRLEEAMKASQEQQAAQKKKKGKGKK